VNEDLVEKMLGSGVSVSPVVTIEPRHRKFHQPISITIPLPPKSSLRGGKTRPTAGTPTLRLLCSMTGLPYKVLFDVSHNESYPFFKVTNVNDFYFLVYSYCHTIHSSHVNIAV